jgi:hypothetical protein
MFINLLSLQVGMRKSSYGAQLTYLWEGDCSLDSVVLTEVPSTLRLANYQTALSEGQKVLEKDPHFYDGPKWRTEGVRQRGSILEIKVSPTSYLAHRVLQKVHGKSMSFYPNPITVNPLQVTEDGYALLATRGTGSDQRGLCLLGSGSIERAEGPLARSIVKMAVAQECTQEALYLKDASLDFPAARVMAVMFGSNCDSTIGVYLPVRGNEGDVMLHPRSREHTELVPVRANAKTLKPLLERGTYEGVPVADHALGCLESYMRLK